MVPSFISHEIWLNQDPVEVLFSSDFNYTNVDTDTDLHLVYYGALSSRVYHARGLFLILTVHRRFWYLIRRRTMLAVLVAMENSCCSVTLERKPLNMKMLGAMTTETLLSVILFLAWWSITRWKNSTNAWRRKKEKEIYKRNAQEFLIRKWFTDLKMLH